VFLAVQRYFSVNDDNIIKPTEPSNVQIIYCRTNDVRAAALRLSVTFTDISAAMHRGGGSSRFLIRHRERSITRWPIALAYRQPIARSISLQRERERKEEKKTDPEILVDVSPKGFCENYAFLKSITVASRFLRFNVYFDLIRIKSFRL